MSDERWNDDSIQFPRLLAEIVATQDNIDDRALCEAMDLEPAELDELFERAQRAWEQIKAETDNERLAEYGVARAIDDFALIETAARHAQMGLMTNRAGSLVLVDGTQYSPSWRAMAGGSSAYDADVNEGTYARCEAYEEQLDELIDQWSGRHEETLSWEDGCLFVFGAEFDFDQLA